MKTRKDLIRASTYRAIMILKDDPSGKTLFPDLEHFLDENMEEIGHVYDPLGLEIVTVFNPPRQWGESTLKRFLIKPIVKVYKTMIVTIPARDDHEGIHSMKVEISNVCPKCGEKRGKPFKTVTFDGSRKLTCDGWINPCGHIDLYSEVRKEFWNNLKCKRCHGDLTKAYVRGVVPTFGCDTCGQIHDIQGEML